MFNIPQSPILILTPTQTQTTKNMAQTTIYFNKYPNLKISNPMIHTQST